MLCLESHDLQDAEMRERLAQAAPRTLKEFAKTFAATVTSAWDEAVVLWALR
jgi:hypothetical protein